MKKTHPMEKANWQTSKQKWFNVFYGSENRTWHRVLTISAAVVKMICIGKWNWKNHQRVKVLGQISLYFPQEVKYFCPLEVTTTHIANYCKDSGRVNKNIEGFLRIKNIELTSKTWN